ncbi:hypothetical protein [Thalassovita aquimarina]|uniref:Uncharacterized protein n=1 Tax=Thalassovita aquimarina TaxID=2785917 RepID=A0ABS5HSD4_9RHOB|nr:hypothetical protein [Thalassovita aquimarina]MBR9651871.1 hypothetical protein [Thalassovita aquimarina]
MSEKELESIKQKLSDLEAQISDIDLDRVRSKKGSKLKDRMVAADLEAGRQRLSALEEILDDIDPEDRSAAMRAKLKDRM